MTRHKIPAPRPTLRGFFTVLGALGFAVALFSLSEDAPGAFLFGGVGVAAVGVFGRAVCGGRK